MLLRACDLSGETHWCPTLKLLNKWEMATWQHDACALSWDHSSASRCIGIPFAPRLVNAIRVISRPVSPVSRILQTSWCAGDPSIKPTARSTSGCPDNPVRLLLLLSMDSPVPIQFHLSWHFFLRFCACISESLILRMRCGHLIEQCTNSESCRINPIRWSPTLGNLAKSLDKLCLGFFNRGLT